MFVGYPYFGKIVNTFFRLFLSFEYFHLFSFFSFECILEFDIRFVPFLAVRVLYFIFGEFSKTTTTTIILKIYTQRNTLEFKFSRVYVLLPCFYLYLTYKYILTMKIVHRKNFTFSYKYVRIREWRKYTKLNGSIRVDLRFVKKKWKKKKLSLLITTQLQTHNTTLTGFLFFFLWGNLTLFITWLFLGIRFFSFLLFFRSFVFLVVVVVDVVGFLMEWY